jgi:hypothetical protein
MSDRTDKSVRSVLALPIPEEKFTARFDEKLVEQPNDKYVKPVIPPHALQTPITVNIQVNEKSKKSKKGCSIQ